MQPVLQSDEDLPTSALPGPHSTAAEAGLDYRRERGRRLALSVATSIVTKPLAIVISLVTVPLYIRYLGTERFGLYEAVLGLATWLSLSNLGLGLGLTNRLVECHVAEDREKARQYVSTMAVASLAIAIVAATGWTLLSFAIDWGSFFSVTSELARQEAGVVVLLTGLLTLLGMAVRLTPAIYNAYQESHRNNLWDGVIKAITLAAACAIVATPFGLPGVVVAMLGVPALVGLVNTVYFFGWEKPWLRPALRHFKYAHLRTLVSQSLALLALQASVVLIYQSDKFVIGALLGADAVTPYAVLGRVYLTAYGMYTLVLTPLWPAYGEALQRGDVAWVKRTQILSMLVGMGLSVACGLVLLTTGSTIIAWWTRTDTIEVSSNLIIATAGVFLLRPWVDSRSIVLNAAGVVRPQVYAFAAYAVAALVLAVVLVPRYGAAGAAWGSFIGGVLTVGWSYPLMLRSALRRRDRDA